MFTRRAVPILGLLLGLALLNGCATKKYVKQEVAATQADLSKKIDEEASRRVDLGNQVAELSSLNKKNSAHIDSVEGNLDKAVKTLDPKIDDAKKTGVEARETANVALGNTKENATAIQNRNNYAIVSTDAVYFKSASATLDEKGKATLENVAKTVIANKNLVLELQGFTDSVGDASYNLRLSEQRVESVLRYLVSNLKVDLYRVSKLGLGADNPADSNKTRDGRAKNRRVEVRVLGVK
jgi:outer membrane protein OmpA-like peptidoglycan-associated protein